jgi:hypothetical protein
VQRKGFGEIQGGSWEEHGKCWRWCTQLMSFHMGVWARFSGMVILLFDRLDDIQISEYNHSG